MTGAGRLKHQAIIHVAGINMLWFATEYSIAQSVINAIRLVNKSGFSSVALPLIGAGSGNRSAEFSTHVMLKTLEHIKTEARVLLVQYKP